MNLRTMKEPVNLKKKRSVFFKDENGGPGIQFDELENEYIISMKVPGLKKNDFEISVEQNRLIIISTEDTAHIDKIVRRDDRCSYDMHQLRRSFALPSNADTNAATANWDNGSLIIHFPKTENPYRTEMVRLSIH